MKQTIALLLVVAIILVAFVFVVLPAFNALANNPGEAIRQNYASAEEAQQQLETKMQNCENDFSQCVNILQP
jgi:F0F1-type ATP synthase membrane subunit b/b'